VTQQTESKHRGDTLSPEELRRLHAYWRAQNSEA